MWGLVMMGLLAASLAQMLALLMTGAGHGWTTPFYFSPALFVLYPIVLIRLRAPQELPSRALDWLLVAAAIALDYWLVQATRTEGVEYFRKLMGMPPLPHIWLLLWIAWQALAIRLAVSGSWPRSRG